MLINISNVIEVFSCLLTYYPTFIAIHYQCLLVYHHIYIQQKIRKFKVDFLENKSSNDKFLFYIFDFFFRVESPPFRLYHQFPNTLYILYEWININILSNSLSL